jgi:two-component system CheB/CheR fusion protein
VADPARLQQVLVNLLTNAAKYTNEGGSTWLNGTVEGNEVVVRVKDTGIGLSAEVLPKIFDAFTQAPEGGRLAQGGLGLGLALVRNLVELHGGSVQALSEGEGKGTEFTVRLPALEG